MSDSVNLTISKDIVNPIVNQKIQEAISEALGGKDALVAKVIDGILQMKVDSSGKPSQYSDAKPFIDHLVFKQVEDAIKAALTQEIIAQSANIREVLVKQIQSKKGATMVANALIDSMNGSFANSYRTSLQIEFSKLKD